MNNQTKMDNKGSRRRQRRGTFRAIVVPKFRMALGLLLLLAGVVRSTADVGGWSETVGPQFAPSVPSSAGGNVSYTYEFYGDASGAANYYNVHNTIQTRTHEEGSVGGTAITSRTAIREVYRLLKVCVTATTSHDCLQWLIGSTYTPDTDDGPCDYADGDFFNSVNSSLVYEMGTLSLSSTTISDPSGHWEITYYYPASTPLGYHHSAQSGVCGGSGASFYVSEADWDGYYKIVVSVDAGYSIPAGTLPGLPYAGAIGGSGPLSLTGMSKRISAGGVHSLAAKLDGTVWAWGSNYNGQLGDGTTTDRDSPVQVDGISGAIAVEAGADHSLCLLNDGTVWAWGRNHVGQLGDGTTTERHSPVQVSGLSNIVCIAAGFWTSYAVEDDGTVWAWGRNQYGQLGDGTITDRHTPVQVSSISNIVDVQAGAATTFATEYDGTVWGWGRNDYGQIGDGTTTDRHSPEENTYITDAAEVSPGTFSTVALKLDGTVWAWGRNLHGIVGDGTTTQRLTPVQTSTISEVLDVDAANSGGFHGLYIEDDSGNHTGASCGYNWYGQLGDGATTDRSSPYVISSLTGLAGVSAGTYHSLAVDDDLHIHAWGSNWNGQLGDGTTTDHHSPVTISGFGL